MKSLILMLGLQLAFNSLTAQTLANCPRLIFKFGGGMSRIPIYQLKSLNEARIEMNDYSKTDYILQKFTITVLVNETQTFSTLSNEGNTFSEKAKALLNAVKPKDIIMVSGISAVDKSGNVISVDERNFGFY
ncbi:MAG: GldM family protein [Ferruginibacter sp.]